jgi:hypothetical protein
VSDGRSPIDCRIVGFQEFAALPEGTLYADWEPCIIGETHIKGATIFHDGKPGDFWYQNFGADIYCQSRGEMPNHERVVVEEIQSRWGLFDYDALFIVYPLAAIELMIERLKRCAEVAHGGD